jgi:hypothetical protein
VSELEDRGWANAYPELAKVIKHAKKAHQHVGLEELWTCIDLHTKFPGAFPISWEPRPVVCELKSALVRMYGSSCDEISESISMKDCCTVVGIANEIEAGDTLISFNYDTIIERVVSKIAKPPLRHGSDLKPETIRFAKPHGSTSWAVKKLTHRVTGGAPILDSLAHDAVRDTWPHLDPLLLGAVPLKSELISEVQEYYRSQRVFEVVREQWITVAKAVASATRIVVLGYSFPKEDAYGRFFFNEGKAMRDDGLSLQVDVFNLNSDAVQSLGELFPNASSVCFKGPISAAKFCTT